MQEYSESRQCSSVLARHEKKGGKLKVGNSFIKQIVKYNA